MRILFSTIGLFAVLGVAVWWMMQRFAHDTGLIAPSDTGAQNQIETPIDEAKQVKQLIESHTTQVTQ